MGVWSASITGNDLANDLLSEYTAAFSYYDVQTALEKIESYVRNEEGCRESDPGEWCSFFYWYTFCKYGYEGEVLFNLF